MVTLSGSSAPEPSLADHGRIDLNVSPGLQEIHDVRQDAADDAARAGERTPEPDTAERKKPKQKKPTAEPSTPAPEGGGTADSDDEPADPGDGPAEPTDDPDTEQDDDGFDPVPGCNATVPHEGRVANGELGDEYLCDVGDGFLLRPDAGAAFLALAEEYESDQDGSLLSCVGNTYRSYEQQVEVYQQKPNLAAEPGTSEHGWGLAIDFECGANSYDSSFYAWLSAHGDEYGWINPPWAQPGGSRPEPWHWEFVFPTQ